MSRLGYTCVCLIMVLAGFNKIRGDLIDAFFCLALVAVIALVEIALNTGRSND